MHAPRFGMNPMTSSTLHPPARFALTRRLARVVAPFLLGALVTSCGWLGSNEPGHPSISVQPQSLQVEDEQAGSFSVEARGAAPLSYQWQRDGQPIAGATDPTYSIATVRATDDGASFSVLVSNPAGSTLSEAAVLTVIRTAPAVERTGPGTIDVTIGQSPILAVEPNGSGPLEFTWRRNGVPIPDSNTAGYQVPPVELADSGVVYDVVVISEEGAAISLPYTLNVTASPVAPSIVDQPQAMQARAGQPARFSVAARGTIPLAYQWQRNGIDIPGANASTLDLASTAPDDDGVRFSVVVSNGAGTASSNAVTLLVRTRDPGLAALAGTIGSSGNADGAGAEAAFQEPAGLAVDAAGNLYIADRYNHVIRKMTPAGVVTTLAGQHSSGVSTLLGIGEGNRGSNDGPASEARFDSPQDVAVDQDGNVYVADTSNSTIRKISPEGEVTTLAGSPGDHGYTDGHGSSARFDGPRSIVADADGTLYVGDGTDTIRKVTRDGNVTLYAGGSYAADHRDGPAASARFARLSALAFDSAGNLLVADGLAHVIRKIDTSGNVTTIAGTPYVAGDRDGPAAEALLNKPSGITVDGAGTIYVSEGENGTLRRIGTDGIVSTLAGIRDGGETLRDGTGNSARFGRLGGVVLGPDGRLLVADTSSIRRVTPEGIVTTPAGPLPNVGSDDGTGATASFATPVGIARDRNGDLVVTDASFGGIRRITPSGIVTTIAGRDSEAASDASFEMPTGVAIDADGTIYFSDSRAHTVHRISPTGIISTVAGRAFDSGATDGDASIARLDTPIGLALAADGDLFVADAGNHTIRRIGKDGTVSTVAGEPGDKGADDGDGAAARFFFPTGIAFDRDGNLLVSDTGNSTIRRVTPSGTTTTVAGLAGKPGLADGSGSSARFRMPGGIAVDEYGNAYIPDADGGQIRRLAPDGEVTTLAGAADGRVGVRLGELPGRLPLPFAAVMGEPGVLYVTTLSGVLRFVLP